MDGTFGLFRLKPIGEIYAEPFLDEPFTYQRHLCRIELGEEEIVAPNYFQFMDPERKHLARD